MTFGEKVKNLRKNKGLNQTQLADAVGVSLRTVRGWEIEGRYPKNMTFTRNLQTF
ncbi:XRE family transcriptional regulator [gut metagenome]|uniref:XRE family transcriptional regulator n=1 Tax=gut metagenome TaxID=749906 RepID=J9FHP0_9ZZZZ